VSQAQAVRWWSVRPAQSRKPATYTCPFCGQHLPAFSEHMLVLPEGDAGRRRHAHTHCAVAARKAGRLPSREEWLAALKVTSHAAAPTNGAPGGEEAAETNGLAIASLFLGIIWLFGLGSIVAIALGYAGMKQIDASAGHQSGRAIAIAGIVIGIVGLASMGILVGFLISSSHNTPLVPGPSP
jgi:preprotein translocase subunit Sss1